MNNYLYQKENEAKCEYIDNNDKSNIVYDIIEDIYENSLIINNIETIFKESYISFIDFIKFNIIIEKSYEQDENIDKYSKLYISLLYDVIYSKASYEEELLNDFINDEDGNFFEYYKNYTPSKNIKIISELNNYYSELNNIKITLHNLDILRLFVLRCAKLYISIISENEV
jgi:hypothetical protein